MKSNICQGKGSPGQREGMGEEARKQGVTEWENVTQAGEGGSGFVTGEVCTEQRKGGTAKHGQRSQSGTLRKNLERQWEQECEEDRKKD